MKEKYLSWALIAVSVFLIYKAYLWYQGAKINPALLPQE